MDLDRHQWSRSGFSSTGGYDLRKTADQIMDLISNSGKKAPEMTHALKYIGDGDMQKGIGKIE